VSGTFVNLYARIDLLATWGHPQHDKFRETVERIVGLKITMKASPNGKVAGFYFDSTTFVTLDRMGDGISEMVALIVELCLEEQKIFVLEEPETNLHPSGLKALLELIRDTTSKNQFFISTHSNIVLRELGGFEDTRILQVSRDSKSGNSASVVVEIERSPQAHLAILRDLGYEFLDYNLYEGWLFLEESSAETVIAEILIPSFVPELRSKIRTYSAGGATNVAPAVAEFQRLIVFIHLQPVYENRLWVRVDGDSEGINTIETLRARFPEYSEDAFGKFSKQYFELYYPSSFQDKVRQVLGIQDKKLRQKHKIDLLKEVVNWTKTNSQTALAEWKESASEPIEFLRYLANILANE
jgi:hypothetical protein